MDDLESCPSDKAGELLRRERRMGFPHFFLFKGRVQRPDLRHEVVEVAKTHSNPIAVGLLVEDGANCESPLKLAQRLKLSQRQLNGNRSVARVLVVEDNELAVHTQQLMYVGERSDQLRSSFEVENLVEHLNGYDEVEGAWPERNPRCFSLDGQNIRSHPCMPQFSKQFM